jgi:putative ABC transport system substrate-binding protein
MSQRKTVRCAACEYHREVISCSHLLGLEWGNRMKRREFNSLLGGAVVAWPFAVFAQVLARRPLVAVLVAGSSTNVSRRVLNGLSEGLRELGFIEGRDIDIVYRYADGDLARMPALANELMQLMPGVFVTGTIAGTLAIKQATAAIPIVNPALTDPVGFGLVASQARPGGQVTGILTTLDSLLGKQLELVLELIPGATRIGILVNVSNPGNAFHLRTAKAAASALGVELLSVEVRSPADIDAAFQTLAQQRAELLLIIPEALFLNERKRIVALAAGARLPTIYSTREHIVEGGLISYGTNIRESWRRAAAYVDKILKGAKPGDLPVEFPTKVELVINSRTARELALTIPQSLLLRADEVIE